MMSTTPATNTSATERQTPPAASATCVASNQNKELENTSLQPRNLDETKFAIGSDNKRHDHPTYTPFKDDKRAAQKVAHEEDDIDESNVLDLDIDLDKEHLIGQDEVAVLDRFSKGKVTKDCYSLARTLLTFICHDQDAHIKLEGKSMIIPKGKSFRSTESPDDIKFLSSVTKQYASSYMNMKVVPNNNNDDESSEVAVVNDDKWLEIINGIDDNNKCNAGAVYTDTRLIKGAAIFHDINISEYQHTRQKVNVVHRLVNVERTIIITKWVYADSSHVDLTWTPEFVDLPKVLWDKSTNIYEPTDENINFVSNILNNLKGKDLDRDDHFRGCFAVLPLHIMVLPSVIKLIVGRILPTFLEMLRRDNFQPNQIPKEKLDQLLLSSLGSEFSYEAAAQELNDLIEAGSYEGLIEDASVDNPMLLNCLDQRGTYLRFSCITTGKRRKLFNAFIEEGGNATLYPKLYKFCNRWLSLNAEVEDEVMSVIVYGGLAAKQAIWLRWMQEENRDKEDGARLHWEFCRYFGDEEEGGGMTHKVVVAHTQDSSREGYIFEGLCMGLLQHAAASPVQLISGSGNALNQVNCGVPSFLLDGGVSTSIVVDWFKKNSEQYGDEFVETSVEVPKFVVIYLNYRLKEILEFVNGHTPGSKASQNWGVIAGGTPVTKGDVTVSMLHSFMSRNGGSKYISKIQLRARELAVESTITKANASKVYGKVLDIFKDDENLYASRLASARLAGRWKQLFFYLEYTSKETMSLLKGVHDGIAEKKRDESVESFNQQHEPEKAKVEDGIRAVASMKLPPLDKNGWD